MANGVILYQSKYGATQKYAAWLAEKTGFSLMETKKTKAADVSSYDTVVLMGGVYASGIAGLSFLKKNWEVLKGKKWAVFCVGASPYEENSFRQMCAHNLTGPLAGIPCFYGRGAWNLEAMSFGDRTLCKLLQKSVAKKDPSAYEPWEAALMEAKDQSCDWTGVHYLDPLMDFLRS